MLSATDRPRAARRRSAPAACLALVLALAACGEDPPPPRAAAPAADAPQEEDPGLLDDLGYSSGEVEAGPEEGVLIHEAGAWPGRNLVVSAHGPEALLLDMEGRTLHVWRRDFWEIFPDAQAPRNDPNTRYFRRAYPAEDGSLFVIFEGLGIAKLDRDSRVLWQNACNAHHDAEVLPDGGVWVLSRYWRPLRRDGKEVPVLVDYLTLLDADGNVRRQVSLLDALLDSPFAGLVDETPLEEGDVFHTNTLEILDGRAAARAPEFAAGRVLVSIRNLSALAVLDLDEERVVWARRGVFRFQHDPRVLDDGRILLFDNLGARPYSRVLELAPETLEVLWSYTGSEEHPFYSFRCGTAQRLPNGDTLVTESGPGRAFEITRDGRRVWEYLNPGRAANKPRLRARLFDLMRLPPDWGDAWLGTSGD